MNNTQRKMYLLGMLAILLFSSTACLSSSMQLPFTTSKKEMLGNFAKTSDGVYSWCGLSIGMTKDQAVRSIRKQSNATYEWIFNADDGTAIINDNPDSTQTIEEEIDVECEPYTIGMAEFENGMLTDLMIVEIGATIKEYIDFFGDPEQYFVTSVAHPMIDETDVHYAFVYQTRGISFDGEYTDKGSGPEYLDLSSPIMMIHLEDPSSFDAISYFYTQDMTDTRDYPRTLKKWNGRDPVEVEKTTYKSF